MISALAFGAVYSLVGIALLVAGFFVLDLLTPGRLGRHLSEGAGSWNAGVLVSAEFVGLGAIVFTAIWTNAASGFGPALGWTVGFGVVGIVLELRCASAGHALGGGYHLHRHVGWIRACCVRHESALPTYRWLARIEFFYAGTSKKLSSLHQPVSATQESWA